MKLLDHLRSLFSCFVPRNIRGGAELVYGKRVTELGIASFSDDKRIVLQTSIDGTNFVAPDDGILWLYADSPSHLGISKPGFIQPIVLERTEAFNLSVHAYVKKGENVYLSISLKNSTPAEIRFLSI